jgi:parvulin-like peptidyl-prolyl isomerase
MRRGKTAVLGVILALVAGVGLAERIVVEAIMIRVNDRIITVNDFRQRLRQEVSQRPEAPSSAELRTLAERLLRDIVDELLLLERAKEKRLTVDEAQVDRAIEGLREENNLTDDKAFEEALASAGMTEESLRERYRQSMTLQRAVQGEVQATEITEEELRRRYQQNIDSYKVPKKVELEQVFVETAEDGSDALAVRDRANGLVGRVRQGADLKAEATLAGAEVQELGAIPVMDLRPELLDAIADLEEGALTDPLQTAGGYQIIRLVRRVPAGYQPFDEVEEQIRRGLSEERYREQTQGLVDRLREEYLVEVHPEYLEGVLGGAGDA